MSFHIQLSNNYQVVSFDVEDLTDPVIDLAIGLVNRLGETISVDGKNKVEFIPATEQQKKCMDRYHIPYTEKTSKTEAQQLIQKSLKSQL